ncbi:MAG: aminotransferase class III-fold pyridoxal phosphate-dependent enzyme [Limnochordales bacterium]
MGRWSGSLRLYEEAAEHLAGGVSTAFRRGTHPAPVYAQRAQGARLIDVDGNEYIDYMMAYGPLIHGHAHPAIVEALTRQAPLGTTYGVQHQGEVELARRLTRYVPCADLVCFVNSGTEANLVALRVARAYTGRQKIIRFNGHYHGWADPLLVKPAAELQGLAPQAATGGQSAAASKHGVPLLIHRVGPVFHTLFTDRSAVSRYEEFAQCVDQAAYRRFSDELFRHGVLVRPSGLWYVSTAHEEADIEATLAAADRAFAAVK